MPSSPRLPHRSGRLRAALLALLLGVVLTGLGATPAAAGPAEDLLAKVNAERAAVGAGPLRLDGAMNQVAGAWSQAMADAGEMSHNPSYASQIPAGWTAAAENVAWNRPADVAGLHTAWMNSAGHRANILNPAFTDVGIAVVVVDGRAWGTQVFAAYGAPPPAPAPAPVEEPSAPAPAPAPEPEPAPAEPPARAAPAEGRDAPEEEVAEPAEPEPTPTPTPTPAPTLTATAAPAPTPTPSPSASLVARAEAERAATGVPGPVTLGLGALGALALGAAVLLLRRRAQGGSASEVGPSGGDPEP
ncbi:CAP domain-containing protein [Actinotalea soli]|uniref:CAP domain-containing protein n=1 Tax=Actinotalea soli TaxID=2819234 RepID=UPI002739421E|nr:CAP domain-containing protein [Actinotalea soli]